MTLDPQDFLYLGLAIAGIFTLGIAVGYGLPRGRKPVIRYKDRATGRFVKE